MGSIKLSFKVAPITYTECDKKCHILGALFVNT